jgi:hypothetical protein
MKKGLPVVALIVRGACAVSLASLAACSGSSDPAHSRAAATSGGAASGAARSAVLAGHSMDGQAIACAAQADGVRVCQGDESGVGGVDLRFQTFDGAPLSVFVTLPPAPASGADGGYPLVVQNHGWGDPPVGPDDTQYGGTSAKEWARNGYAVLQFAARGWGNSCGSAESRLVNAAACANGYIHLDDYRYEARDVQYAVGLLVDEGIADPNRIGMSGESYGAGLSIELATLKDRVMNPDGSLSPWTSPKGTPIHVAAAAPFAGWSDLVYALRPNGRTFDAQLTSTTADLAVAGVLKLSILSGLYLVGTEGGYYAPAGTNPQADVMTWYALNAAGEPYDTPVSQGMVDQIAQFRSPYYLLAGAYGMAQEAPAPMILANGFTDDVFPVVEVLRYYNLERSLYPSNPIQLFFADIGHQRADNKAADDAQLPPRIKAFFDHYVKGTGPQPALDVTVFTQVCASGAASEGPYRAATWEALHTGEVDFTSSPAQMILSTGGDLTVSKAFDPVFGGLACTTAPGTDQGTGVATYRLPAANGSGYTLLGAPTVTADLAVTGEFAYIAARLLDVDPVANTETLVARGMYRIDPAATDGTQTFQLYPAAWRFANGHIPKLELLGQDTPYARLSNGVFSISISNLKLQLPVHEGPG